MSVPPPVPEDVWARIDATAKGTYREIIQRGMLKCGVEHGLTGFSEVDDNGEWFGFDIDVCRAVSSAVFDSPGLVEFVALPPDAPFQVLASGEVDMLPRPPFGKYSDDPNLVQFGSFFEDGLAMMIPQAYGINSVLEMDGAVVCVRSDNGDDGVVQDYFTAENLNQITLTGMIDLFDLTAYQSGNCDAIVARRSDLHALLAGIFQGRDHVILPELMSFDDIGPLVRADDEEWATIVTVVGDALYEGDLRGITSADALTMVHDKAAGKSTPVFDLEGYMPNTLPDDFMLRVIFDVGNLSELYNRHLGQQTPVNMEFWGLQ